MFGTPKLTGGRKRENTRLARQSAKELGEANDLVENQNKLLEYQNDLARYQVMDGLYERMMTGDPQARWQWARTKACLERDRIKKTWPTGTGWVGRSNRKAVGLPRNAEPPSAEDILDYWGIQPPPTATLPPPTLPQPLPPPVVS